MNEPTTSRKTEDSRRSTGFFKAVMVSILGTGLSRIFGAVRDIAIARVFGASGVSDAFWVAFTVPNTLRRFVADEGLTGALIPAIARTEAEDSLAGARDLANRVFTVMLLVNVCVCVAGWIGAPWLVKAFAYKFVDDPEKFQLTVELTRWLMPFVAMVSLVSFFEGLLNHRGHFFVPKVAPGLVSAGMVAMTLWARDHFDRPIYALAAGVWVGGLVHVLVNVPVLWRRWGRLSIDVHVNTPRVRKVLVELGKVVLIGVFAQVNILVLRQLAAMVGEGGITHYWYANRLVDLSQGVIAVAVGSALLPNVSAAVAERRWDQVRLDLHRALRLTAFLLVPTALALAAVAEPLTAMLFRHGRWTWADTVTTAQTLRMLIPFMLSIAMINVIKKVYFALDDRDTLLRVGVAGIVLTGVTGWFAVRRLQVPGLAMALSVSATAQLVVYVVLLSRRLPESLGLSSLLTPIAKMTLAGGVASAGMAAVASRGQWEQGPTEMTNWLVFGAAVALGATLWALVARVSGLQEYHSLAQRLSARLSKR